MADEPRRSVRATKGQHTKSLDALDQPIEAPKKRGKKASKKAAAEEAEVEVIRCVCGATETGDDDGEAWIACDNCGVWQHNICVGVSPFEEDTPEHYLCEQCAPEAHKELLSATARGEKLWEERRKTFEREQAEEKASKKAGKKGKKRTSDSKLDINATNGKIASPAPSTPVDTKKEKKEPASRAGSAKRKSRDDDSHEKEPAKAPQSKIRKVSAVHSASQQPSPQDLPAKIQDLEKARQGPAILIQKSLLHAIPISIKAGIYTLGDNETVQSTAERLAIQIEDAVYKTHPDKDAYVKQTRSVSFNLKQNQELSNRILTKSLRPDALAVMTTDEMATKELQREKAEMQARVDKQSILITDDAPRVRRTHKGEELVESEVYEDPAEYKTPAPRRRSMLDPNADMAGRSRETSPIGGDEVELPANINDYKSTDNIRANATPKPPLNIDTKPAPPMRKPSTPNDFDINKVFSSVQSPSAGQHPRRPSTIQQSTGPGVDPEIDKMLQDDNESPPYSPAEYNSDPDIIWQGTVTMDSIAKFPAIAKHVGGADLSRNGSPPVSWSDLLQKDLRVAGRIDQDKANEYLCSLRYSQPTDLVVIAVTPVGEAATQGWRDTINYFHSKHRYGVFANKGPSNIRDTYLVPVPASPVSLPDFITNLEGHKLSPERTEPMMLFALIIRNEYHPEGSKSSDGTPVMGHPQRQMSISSQGPYMSPINQQGAFQPPPPGSQNQQTPSQGFNNNDSMHRYQQEEQRRTQQQREGEAVAAKILGPLITAPTVHFLLPQAYQMRPVEWQVIKDIFEREPKAQQDLAYLSQLLENKKPGE
ncbi:SPOC domain-containing protein [Xylogone sp. PMI_703]|nr:SPOC domain-containing protein [Xylogone sp. PMI_703]